MTQTGSLSLSTRPMSQASAFIAPIPPSISDTLLHYAATSNATTPHMSSSKLTSIATTLTHCFPNYNFLIFGLTHESLLWQALNFNGRTIYLDENEFLVSKFEQSHLGIKAYDVSYTNKVSDMSELISVTKLTIKNNQSLCFVLIQGKGNDVVVPLNVFFSFLFSFFFFSRFFLF